MRKLIDEKWTGRLFSFRDSIKMRFIKLLSISSLARLSAAGFIRSSVSLAGFMSFVERSFVILEILSVAEVVGSETPWSCEDHHPPPQGNEISDLSHSDPRQRLIPQVKPPER